jgi:Fibronectin type III domain
MSTRPGPRRPGSVVVTLILLIAAATAFGQSSITLAWDPSSDSRIVGYRLYEGIVSGSYTNVIDVGNLTTATVSNLVSGVTYYFALTAFDINGQESPLSTELSYTVPFPTYPMLGISLTPGPGGPIVLNLMGAPGQTCIVLGSDNLATWTPIRTAQFGADGRVQFTDPDGTTHPNRFYRAQIANPMLGISLTPGPGGPIVLNLTGPPGQTCIIQGSDDLNTWTAIGTVQFDANGRAHFTDRDSTILPSRFYRVQIRTGLST